MQYAIEINDVWKKYRIYHDMAFTLKERVLFSNRHRYDDLWALKGLTLTIEKGRAVGLIGPNGSGKSTLLKLLTRIIYPDRGSIEINGKVSSLLELGAGFHPDFSGLENIYMNAAIFGMTRRQIDHKLDDIVAFSELGDFIDSPVRTYSSGMYMRLAFAVAINVEPDVLLIDEILAVGDENFQKKCFKKMQEFKEQKCTLVVVSHAMNDIQKVCDEVIWLKEGEPQLIGDTDYVIDQYRNAMLDTPATPMRISSESAAPASKTHPHGEPSGYKQHDLGGRQEVGVTPNRWGSREAEIYDVEITNLQDQKVTVFNYGEDVVVRYSYRINSDIQDVVFGFGIFMLDGTRCYGTNSQIADAGMPSLNQGKEGVVAMRLSHLYLADGEYVVNIAMHSKEGIAYDYHHRLYGFQIRSGSKDIGIVRPEVGWKIE